MSKHANRVAEEYRLPTLPPGPIDDHCAFCGAGLKVHDVAWRFMRSPEARLIGANFCGSPCYAAACEDPATVLEYLDLLQATDPDEDPPI